MKGHWPSQKLTSENLGHTLAALKEAEKGLQEPTALMGLDPSHAALLAENIYHDCV